MHSQKTMQGRELFMLLLKKRGLTLNGFVSVMKGKVKQPTLHKFLRTSTRESRRSTLQPIAEYFDVPLEAFYDDFLADKIAFNMGLIEPEDIPLHPPLPYAKDMAREAPPPIPLPPPALSLPDALRRLRAALANETPGVRRSVVALLDDFASHAEDHEFSERTIERILGALGHLSGNASAPRSTRSGAASN